MMISGLGNNPLVGVGKNKSDNKPNNVSFGRRLRGDEIKDFPKAIKKGLEILGVQNLAIITHGTCFPSVGRDVGVGSPIGKSAKKFTNLLHMNGFNSNQLGPGGVLTAKETPSPYLGTTFSKNPLFIDLELLTEDRFNKILSKDTHEMVTKKAATSKDKAYNMSNFEMAFESSDIALREAYGGFRKRLKSNEPSIVKMNNNFEKFKNEKDFLHNDAMYESLSLVNKTRDFNKWFDVDKNLNVYIADKNSPKHKMAIKRQEMIEKTMGNEIDFYKFKQFLVNEQEKDNLEFRKGIDFKYIGDEVINFDSRTVWGNQDAFKKGWSIGSVDGGPGGGPQTWDYPLLDPKKLFNDDGSLGTAGKLLRKKYENTLESNQNVRIDHALGIFDPFVYENKTVDRKSLSDPLDRSKLNSGHISSRKDLDPNANYKKIYEKILLPLLEEKNIKPKELVWEDFSNPNDCYTETFKQVYHNEHHLPGITKTLWARSQTSNPDNWSYVTCHDDGPLTYESWGKDNHPNWSPGYLGGYLMPDAKYKNEKHPILGYSRAEHEEKLSKSNYEKAKDKLVALFVGAKNIQVHFTEVFGINNTYNRAGMNHPDNWKLRVDNDFEDVFYKNLEKDNENYTKDDKYEHITLNMPETVMRAIAAKDMMKVADTPDAEKDIVRDTLMKEHKGLLLELKKFANILKEPSN